VQVGGILNADMLQFTAIKLRYVLDGSPKPREIGGWPGEKEAGWVKTNEPDGRIDVLVVRDNGGRKKTSPHRRCIQICYPPGGIRSPNIQQYLSPISSRARSSRLKSGRRACRVPAPVRGFAFSCRPVDSCDACRLIS
jgi:hypothetical protein